MQFSVHIKNPRIWNRDITTNEKKAVAMLLTRKYIFPSIILLLCTSISWAAPNSRFSPITIDNVIYDVRTRGAHNDNTNKAATSLAFLNAVDDCPTSGCTILVPDGDYVLKQDNRAVDSPYGVGSDWSAIPLKSNMRVILSEGATIYLKNDWVAARSCFTSVFGVYGQDNVTIEGGTLVGDISGSAAMGCEWGYGVGIWSSSNVTVKNVRIKNIAGDGIMVTAGAVAASFSDTTVSSKVKLLGNTISYAMRNGITVGAGNDVEIAGNDVSHVGRISDYGPRQAIDLEAESGIIQKVNIHGNRLHDSGLGIVLYPATGSLHDVGIGDNFLWNFSATNGSAVLMNGNTHNVRVMNNHIDNCSSDAITGTRAYAVTVGGNVIGNTTGSGISPYQSWGWNIYENRILGSTSDGMRITGDYGYGTDPILIHRNTIERNGRYGVEVVSGSDVEIDGNAIDNNAASGVHHTLGNFTFIKVKNNSITRNGGVGVDLLGQSPAVPFDNAVILGNSISGNVKYGVRLYSVRNALVSGNKIIGNTLQGVFATGGTQNTISNNIVNSNGSYGIDFLGEDNSAILNNTLHGMNGGYNITIRGSRNNAIMGNYIRAGGASYGIKIFTGSTGNLVTGNDCYGGGTTKGISDDGTSTSFGAGNRKNDGSFAATAE